MIQITSITRGYKTPVDRERAIRLLKRYGYDHFVRYKDTNAEFALCYGKFSPEAKTHSDGSQSWQPMRGLKGNPAYDLMM